MDVTLWHTDFFPKDVREADVHGKTWPEVVEVDGAEAAADVLLDLGLTEESGGGWFQQPDGSVVLSYRTGERRTSTGHVHGFDEDDEWLVTELVRCGGAR